MRLPATIRILCFDAIYLVLLIVSSPWILWRFFVQKKNQRGWNAKLFGHVPTRTTSQVNDANRESTTKCIWLHAVSVGEVNLLIPIVNELADRHPDTELVVSTTTETGYDLACQKFPSRTVFFFPSDFSWAVKRAIWRVKPDVVVLAELEVWPNFIQLATNQGIPVAVFNGRLSESSAKGYRKLKWLLQPTFAQLGLVAAQDETYARRFNEVGCVESCVHVTGNLKFDGAQTDKNSAAFATVHALATRIGLTTAHKIFVAGSTQIEDETAAVKAFLKLRDAFPALRLVIVPRHPARTHEIVSLLESYNLSAVLRSHTELANEGPDSIPDSNSVFIVDVIGELGAWWSLATCAFVGGSMGKRGGQNMIEPAALGVPVCFGPNTKNFRTVVKQLLDRNAALRVNDEHELADFAETILTKSTLAHQMGRDAQAYISASRGATVKTVDLVDALIAERRSSNPDHANRESLLRNRDATIVHKPAA